MPPFRSKLEIIVSKLKPAEGAGTANDAAIGVGAHRSRTTDENWG